MIRTTVKIMSISAILALLVLAGIQFVSAQDSAEHNYVLSSWVWDDTDSNGFWRAPECTDSMIDLRTIPEMSERKTASGYGLFAIDSSCSVPPGAINLGNDVNSKLDFPRKVADEFGLPASTLENRSITEFLWLVMVVNADPTGQNNPKPIHPTTNNDVELRLGNERLKSEKFNPDIHLSIVESHRLGYENIKARYSTELARKTAGYWNNKYGFDVRSQVQQTDGILPPETEISEYWSCANSTSIDCDLTWTIISGTWEIVFGAVENTSTVATFDFQFAGADTALSSADMQATTWASVQITQLRHVGPAIRLDNSTETGYVSMHRSNSTDQLRFGKVVSGTFSSFGTVSLPFFPGRESTQQVSIKASGSTIDLIFDDIVVDSTTDSSIDGSTVGGLNAGIIHDVEGPERAVFSQFHATDEFVTPTPTPTPTVAPTQVEIVSNGEVFDVNTLIFIAGLFIGLVLAGYGERYRVGQYIMAGAVLLVAASVPTGLPWLIILMGLVFIPLMYRGYLHIVVSNRQGKVE